MPHSGLPLKAMHQKVEVKAACHVFSILHQKVEDWGKPFA